ncbi:MAG TPA: CvpA family protein [Candidatus Scybalocola faecipullorum]|nr:CvpA family protein [Candidatus Scybalocola faecipullorum]
MKKTLISIGVTVIYALVAYWFMLPAINLRSKEFYFYLITICAVYLILSLIFKGQRVINDSISQKKVNLSGFRSSHLVTKILLGVIAVCVVVLAGGTLISAEFFHASAYQKLMPVDERDFTEDISQISVKDVPVVDRDSAVRLGNRKLGELVEFVSQFEVDESTYSYTQINYNGVPTRVAPLMYGDLIKWFNNQSEGIPGYISVNMTTQDVTLHRLDEGIKYSPGELFLRKLERHLRFSYPTLIFDDNYVFEIDDEGNPYWICPVVKYRIGLFGGKDIQGVVIVDAQDGSSQYYDAADIPQWVDQAFSSDIAIAQIDYWGEYKRGFWNTIFGQKEMSHTSEGYNYLAQDDDIWLYTGLTSVGSDQSNIGFVLVNLRTKEARYYPVSGATEYSAMASAEGQVQHLNYRATFPILLNVANQPTYFLSLKDNAGLVKQFAFINVERYQEVAIGSTINEAYSQYLEMSADDAQISVDTEDLRTLEAVVTSISTAVIEGNTHYYIQVENSDHIFTASIQNDNILAVIKAGDTISIKYIDSDSQFIELNEIELVNQA